MDESDDKEAGKDWSPEVWTGLRAAFLAAFLALPITYGVSFHDVLTSDQYGKESATGALLIVPMVATIVIGPVVAIVVGVAVTAVARWLARRRKDRA